MSLSEREWNDSAVPDIFRNIQRGKRLKNADHVPGMVPYVSSTALNNGVDDYIEATHGTRVFSDCISLANSGSVGTAFYEPFEYVASDHVTSLKCEHADKHSYLFLASVLEKQGVNFNFNREINDARVRHMRVMLPVNDGGNPDWDYMSSFAESMRGGLLMRYKNYVARRLSELEYKEIPAVDEVEWNEFTIEDLFTILPGKRLEKRNMNTGDRPFIGASDSNNGVTAFMSNTNESLDRNVLGINYNGSVCEAFYHPYECVFSDDVKRLHLKDIDDNEFVLLFMGMAIRQQKNKYEYAYKFNEQRMRRQKIMLPSAVDGKPDYAYMEQYSRNMMLRKYQQYLRYVGRDSAEATKNE